VTGIDAGANFLSGGVPTLMEVTSQMVEGAYCVVRQKVEPGKLFWPHMHSREEQVIIVLSGEIGVRVGDDEWTVAAGEIAYRPRDLPHASWNCSDKVAEILEITSPGHFHEYLSCMNDLADSDAAGKQALLEAYGVTAMPEWVDELSQRYGVSM
jgi:mannose-6-phosphate isomerase-like protein (cupin superfamily)